MVTFSEYLLDRIRGAKARFRPDWSDLAIVLNQLLFAYHCCIASEELLLDGAKAAESREDLFSRHLGTYYRAHFEEEKGEIALLVKDLAFIGINPRASAPNPIAMGMIGSQYYMIKHLHPVCLLGYMAIQEADPTKVEVIETLEEAHGKELFSFLRLHAVKDLEHRKDLIALIDQVPGALRQPVIESTDNALAYLGRFYGG